MGNASLSPDTHAIIGSMNIEATIRQYLPKIVHMSLATCQTDRPWVCEVHFVYDDKLNLYFRSLMSRRHSHELLENPNVAGNIVRQHTVDEYPLGVYFEGRAVRLQELPQQEEVAPLFKTRLKIDADIVAEAANPEAHQFYKISVSDWYVFGKLEANKEGIKYHIPWGISRNGEDQ